MRSVKLYICNTIVGIIVGLAIICGIKFSLDLIKYCEFEQTTSTCENRGTDSEPHYYLSYYVDSEEYAIDLSKYTVTPKEGSTIDIAYNVESPSQVVALYTLRHDFILLLLCLIAVVMFRNY